MTEDLTAGRTSRYVSPHPLDPKRIRPKKVAIVAYTETRELAPYGDPEWEIWGLNAVGHYMNEMRFHAMFDPHPYDFGAITVSWPMKAEWYDRWGGPVYMTEPSPFIKHSVKYPLDMITKTFAHMTKGEAWFASTHAYMVALAIVEDFEEIALYGCDFVSAKEEADQKACTAWYLGYAAAKRIKVTVAEGDNLLCHDHLYGYEDDPSEALTAGNIASLMNKGAHRHNEIMCILLRECPGLGEMPHG